MKKVAREEIRFSYQWETAGNSSDPIIALIATSSGLGQGDIKDKIGALVAAGFCVKYARYPNEDLVNQHNDGNNMVREAVDPEIGASQIIDCINSGWNMMPVMGGWSFQDKVPFIVNYFREHPDQKNLAVKMFGFSDNSFGAILQSNDICQFICSTALYCLVRRSPRFAPLELKKYHEASQELLDLLKTGKVISEPRTILFNPDNKLNSLEEFEFYPMHCGNPFYSLTIDEQDEEYKLRHLDSSFFEPSKKYAIALEGFIQRPGRFIHCNENADQLLDKFLAQKQQQGKLLPEFIEMNLFTTRLDGDVGYNYLLYNETSGLIEKNDFNIDKLLKNQGSIKHLLVRIDQDQKDSSNDAHTKIDHEILAKASRGEDLNREDIAKLIDSENKQIEILQENLLAVAQKYNIPVVQNFRFGHSLNMSTVGGGRNRGIAQGESFAMEHIEVARPLTAQSSNQLSQNSTTQFQSIS